MTRPIRVLALMTAAVVVTLSACGGNDDSNTSSRAMSPLADAFADQLDIDAGYGWFTTLDRAEVECFAATVTETIAEQRLTELRFAADNIPLLFEADWTDTEIDTLTDIYDTCVDDTTGTEALVASLFGGVGRNSDCMVAEINDTLGERYWVDPFQARFTPPRIEIANDEARQQADLAGEEPPPPSSFTDLEPILAACIPGYGDPVEYEDDACGGEPCEDPPDPLDDVRVVLECSRDPYVDASFNAPGREREELLPFAINCEDQGRGTLISVLLPAYPCPDGPRDVEITTTGEPITETTITDACATSPPTQGMGPDASLPTLDGPWDSDAFTAPVATAQTIQVHRRILELFDGLIASVDLELHFDDSAAGGTTAALTVTDGHADLLIGRWCNGSSSSALDAFDGAVLFEGDSSLVICAPGQEYRTTQWQKPLATARIGPDQLALVADGSGLNYLDLDTLESRPLLELDPQQDGFAISASYGADRWVLVLSTPASDAADGSRHVVFLDPIGTVLDVPNNPFPAPDTDAPRAAALSDDGNTLVFSSEESDGSSWLIWWDLRTGTETQRVFVIEPHPDDDPDASWPRVSSIDISGDQMLVNLAASNGETHPSRALLVEPDGNVEDLTGVVEDLVGDGAQVRAVSFLEH